MLLNLKITNVALIEDIEIQFIEGFNILSGETGAGKSIILDSLMLILGEPGRMDFIRTGENSASIHALFDIEKEPHLKEHLQNNLRADTSENLLIIERHIYRDKPTVALINHQRVLVQVLKGLTPYLIDIHSQHQNGRLFDSSQHISILDQYAKFTHEINEYKKQFEEAIALNKEINHLYSQKEHNKEMEQFYQFTLNELSKAQLKPNELEELEKDILLLSNIQTIKERIDSAYSLLYSNDKAIISQLQHTKSILENIEKDLPDTKTVLPYIEEAMIKLEPVLDFIKSYRNPDESSIDSLEDKKIRFNHLKDLQSKYKKTIEELILYKEELEKSVQETNVINIENLENKRILLIKSLEKQAKSISKERKIKAKELEEAIKKELLFLKLNNVEFQLDFKYTIDEQGSIELEDGQKVRLHKDGLDKVEFLISFNKGESLKPLTKVASGGEISRVMLALKSVFSRIDMVATQIFDEVDAGIGGETAFSIGKKLEEISFYKQIICITHLPQIAAMGNLHYQVKKIVENNRTQTIIVPLTEKERVNEISRMLSGDLYSETSLQHAQELLNLRNKTKESENL